MDAPPTEPRSHTRGSFLWSASSGTPVVRQFVGTAARAPLTHCTTHPEAEAPSASSACLSHHRPATAFPRAITGSSKPRRHFSFGSEAYFSFSAMVRYRSRLGSVFAAHFLNSGSSPPWRSFSSPRRPGRRTQRIKARLLFIAQRTVEFRERGLHGLHRAKRGVEPLLHRLDPTRGGQRLVG
jgi:hypothetical protein